MKSLLILFFMLPFVGKAQLNVELLHQLIAENKSEYTLQNESRDKQTVSSANEETNRSLVAKWKTQYRTLQSRFGALGLAIDFLQVAIEAEPILSDIIEQQSSIYTLCKDDPKLLILAIETEADLLNQASSLLNFSYGLILSIGEINQMRSSDRRILFAHILTQLRAIAGASSGLASTLQYSARKTAYQLFNPFGSFVDQDISLINNIVNRYNRLNP